MDSSAACLPACLHVLAFYSVLSCWGGGSRHTVRTFPGLGSAIMSCLSLSRDVQQGSWYSSVGHVVHAAQTRGDGKGREGKGRKGRKGRKRGQDEGKGREREEKGRLSLS